MVKVMKKLQDAKSKYKNVKKKADSLKENVEKIERNVEKRKKEIEKITIYVQQAQSFIETVQNKIEKMREIANRYKELKEKYNNDEATLNDLESLWDETVLFAEECMKDLEQGYNEIKEHIPAKFRTAIDKYAVKANTIKENVKKVTESAKQLRKTIAEYKTDVENLYKAFEKAGEKLQTATEELKLFAAQSGSGGRKLLSTQGGDLNNILIQASKLKDKENELISLTNPKRYLSRSKPGDLWEDVKNAKQDLDGAVRARKAQTSDEKEKQMLDRMLEASNVFDAKHAGDTLVKNLAKKKSALTQFIELPNPFSSTNTEMGDLAKQSTSMIGNLQTSLNQETIQKDKENDELKMKMDEVEEAMQEKLNAEYDVNAAAEEAARMRPHGGKSSVFFENIRLLGKSCKSLLRNVLL